MSENNENMEKVREAMQQAQADKVRLGGDLNTGVELKYDSTEGNHYEGIVVFKKPTMKDYMKMGALKSEFLRQAGIVDVKLVDNSIKEMAQIMATLSTVIIKRPEWLMNLETIEEPDLLYYVYDRYTEWEDSFRKPAEGEPSGDSEATK